MHKLLFCIKIHWTILLTSYDCIYITRTILLKIKIALLCVYIYTILCSLGDSSVLISWYQSYSEVCKHIFLLRFGLFWYHDIKVIRKCANTFFCCSLIYFDIMISKLFYDMWLKFFCRNLVYFDIMISKWIENYNLLVGRFICFDIMISKLFGGVRTFFLLSFDLFWYHDIKLL